MGQVHIRHGDIAQFQDLAETLNNQAALKFQGPGGRAQRPLAPRGQTMMTPGKGHAGVVTAGNFRQDVDVGGCLLHQEQVGVVFVDQMRNLFNGRAARVQEVPANDHPFVGRLSSH